MDASMRLAPAAETLIAALSSAHSQRLRRSDPLRT
jgi:hypothetical protein